MKKIVFLALVSFVISACSSSDSRNGGGSANCEQCIKEFNRKATLTHWADAIIIPNYETYNQSIGSLKLKAENFTNSPSVENLALLKSALSNTYLLWQTVAPFELGKAKAVDLRDYTNVYPTNVKKIEQNIAQQKLELNLPDTNTQQGLPALDYLVNGLAQTPDKIVQKYQDDKYKKYLIAVVDRLQYITQLVVDDWKNSYREKFIQNDGTSAVSSVNVLANDYLLYYEKYMRNGKLRFPSGAATGKAYPEKVESYYNPELSFPLLIKSLQTMQNFFNGKRFSNQPKGLGFSSYLDKYHKITGGENISDNVNRKYDEAIALCQKMMKEGETLENEIKTNNKAILELHDVIQSNIINLKVDMFQAMGVSVQYVDGDGD
ncbi:peptidase M75 superfamily protein [Ornithobacterium rhinotracheale]|uniref:imelysin family protein n=1 Tax=Ornithobacterium rhinotracheale TaxID=28251 RepID=UPI00129C89EB|nr:imelysin family protein [Ornithobacterium rhinotracheale]MRJ07760.1 peptidase M75 superfamily protein [Ornithobacterium rhinotracheale]UOH78719.1 imelysin family protein [Ornithobacterium rhinotracheale]